MLNHCLHVHPCRCALSHPFAMGWLQLVGSLKLSVSFAEYRLFYRALLQKRPINLRSLLIVAAPYLSMGRRSRCRGQRVGSSCSCHRARLWAACVPKSGCCSVLQCVAMSCSVLHCVAVCCSVLQCAAVCCSALQCVAVCCSVLLCAAVCYSVLQCATVCCRALQCVAVCCSVARLCAACMQEIFLPFLYSFNQCKEKQESACSMCI